MRKKTVMLALTAVLLLGLLAGCNNAPPVEPYPGAFDTPYSLGDMFTINVTNDIDTRDKYVVCTVTLELSDATLAETFKARNHRLRDIVIASISDKPMSQLSEEGRRESLKAEILEKINTEFNTTGVSRVFFSEFFFHT